MVGETGRVKARKKKIDLIGAVSTSGVSLFALFDNKQPKRMRKSQARWRGARENEMGRLVGKVW